MSAANTRKRCSATVRSQGATRSCKRFCCDQGDFCYQHAEARPAKPRTTTHPCGNAAADDSIECSICFESLKPRQRGTVRLPCSHVFCYKCIDKWIKHKDTCPNCRGQMQPKEIKRIDAFTAWDAFVRKEAPKVGGVTLPADLATIPVITELRDEVQARLQTLHSFADIDFRRHDFRSIPMPRMTVTIPDDWTAFQIFQFLTVTLSRTNFIIAGHNTLYEEGKKKQDEIMKRYVDLVPKTKRRKVT